MGIDWNAHRVFDKWLKYENEHGTAAQIAHVYTQAVATVTEEHKRLNTAFLEFSSGHEASNLMSEEEYVSMTIKVCPDPRFCPLCNCSGACAAHTPCTTVADET